MAVSAAALRNAAGRLTRSPAAEQAQRLWKGRFSGGVAKVVVGIGGLCLVLGLVLRNNEPPVGIFVYGGIIGLLYALLAFGLILIYRANRIINFAQAEMGATSGVLGVLLIKVDHVPYLVALIIALGSGILAGVVIDFLIIRRFAKASRLVLSVATIGLALIFSAVQLYMPKWMGAGFLISPAPPKTPFSSLQFTIGHFRLDANSIVAAVVVLLVMVGLAAFFRFTDIGIAVRATAENSDRAALLGIPVKRISTVVWALAAALSALAIFLRVPIIGLPIGTFVGPVILLYGLAAAVIARMESFGVALFAGLALGILDQTIYYFSRDPTVSAAVILPIILAFMLFQRNQLSRGEDTGLSTWSNSQEFRPIPPELKNLPEVQWGRFGLGLATLLLLVFGYNLLSSTQQILSSAVVIYGIVAVSLVILTGWAGQISLGQWGLAAVGAGLAGNLAARHNMDFFLTLVISGLAGALVAVVIGLPALRIRGLYLAVTTLGFAITMQDYFLSPSYFGSLLAPETQAINRPILYGVYSLVGDRTFYYASLVVLALAVISARGLRRSRFGRVLVGLRDNQKGAQAFGVSPSKAKLWAFAISGFWAAVAGAMFAYYQGSTPTESFPPELSLTLLIIVVIGGVTSLPGALLGTAFYGVLQYSDLSPAFQLLASGLGALILLLIFPGGLAQIFYGIRDGILRQVATRRGIIVASLVADQRAPDEPEEDHEFLIKAVNVSGEADRLAVVGEQEVVGV